MEDSEDSSADIVDGTCAQRSNFDLCLRLDVLFVDIFQISLRRIH